MSRRTSLGVVASLVLSVGIAGTVAAGTPTCDPESTTDLWDVSQGAAITGSSGFGGGTDDNMFGATDPSAEAGVTFFRDDQVSGFLHFVEWSTADPVQVDSIHIRAAHDGDNPQRMFSSFTVFGWNTTTSTWDELWDIDPAFPYGDGQFNGGPMNNLLDRCPEVTLMVTDRFRAEFVQAVTTSFPGPRVIELDAFGSVVLPPVSTPVASLADTAAPIRPSPSNPAVPFGAALVLAGALGAILLLGRRRSG